MPRKRVKSKRKRFIPFDIMDYDFFIDALMKDPNHEPSDYELEELKSHGITIEDFRKNHKYFVKHRDSLLKGG